MTTGPQITARKQELVCYSLRKKYIDDKNNKIKRVKI